MAARLTATAVASALCLAALPAAAGSKIFSSGGTVATVNGSVEFNANQNRDPFVAQVFTLGNECLRIAVVSQGADLEATLVSASGRVWQDDDSNGTLRPLIKAQTDVRGWYPLVLSQFAGVAVNADFTMTVQRGASTSALCAGATPPRVLAPLAAEAAKRSAPTARLPGGAN